MAFEHNDIATKSGLRAGLGETSMGFEHNDIVTVDVMNAAIAAGGGGGEGSSITVTLVSTNASAVFSFDGSVWDEDLSQNVISAVYEVIPNKWAKGLFLEGITNTEVKFLMFDESMQFGGNGGTLTVSGDAVIDTYDEEYGYSVTITGDCSLTMA